MNIQEAIKEEFEGLLKDLDDNVRPVVKDSLTRIGIYVQRGLQSGDWVRAQQNISFEKSILASQASIASTEAKIRLKKAVEVSISWLIDQMLRGL
jgi:hypothetical protein